MGKPMRGDAVETQCRGSRGVSPGEDEDQERIGLRVRVTLRTLGTDPAVAQTPGVPLDAASVCSSGRCLQRLAVRVEDSGTSNSSAFGSGGDEVFGPDERGVFRRSRIDGRRRSRRSTSVFCRGRLIRSKGCFCIIHYGSSPGDRVECFGAWNGCRGHGVIG